MRKYFIVEAFLIIISMIVLCVSAARAAMPLSTDDPGTISRGAFELEIGLSNSLDENNLKNISSGLSLKHGVTEKMDIGISFPFQIEPAPKERFGAAALGLKFLLIKDIFAMTLNNEMGSSKYLLNSVFSQKFGSLAVFLNAGYIATGTPDAEGRPLYGAAAEYSLNKFSFISELTADKAGLSIWLIGIKYRFGKIVTLSFAYGNSIKSPGERFIFGSHLEFE